MDILGGIKRLFQDLTNYLKSIYDGFVEFFIDIWLWLKSVVEVSLAFIKDCFESVFDFVTNSIRTTAQWFVEQVKFLGRWLWETAIYLFDYCVTAFVGFIDWFLNLLPDIDLPSGFDDGIGYIIQYGMILNEILPIVEGFFMLGVFFGVLAVVSVVRLMLYIIRLLPFKST